MKKYFAWMGAAVMVMALASPSLAQTAWKSWGHMEIVTLLINKPDLGRGGGFLNVMGASTSSGTGTGSGVAATVLRAGDDNTLRQIAERFRFYLQYGDPKTVRGVIGFEADSTDWGESGWTQSETNVSNPSGRMGAFRTDQPQLEVKWAFIEFVVPNTPVSVAAGLQTFWIGGRLFQSNDAPGVTVTANLAPHKIFAYWWRERDVDPLTYNTSDMYGLQYQVSQKLFNVYAYGFYKNGLAGLTNASAVVTNANFMDHPWWLGIGGGYRPGNFDFSGQFIYVGGKQESKVAGVSDKDYSGWVGELLAAYRIGPGLKVALEGYYATGNDADDPNKIKAWTYPTGTEAVNAMGNDRSIFYFINNDFITYSGIQRFDQSLWYGRANVEYNPFAWLNLNFNYLYFGDTTKGTPSALSVTTGRKVINGQTNAQTYKDEDYVGSELNVIAKIKIYQPLYYNVGFGYFIPGAVYDLYDTAGNKIRSPDNAWSLLTCLRYFF